MKTKIPATKSLDTTMQLMRDPYRFISINAKQLETDVFETRLLLEKTICMTGKEAAQIFTDEKLFKRKGAAPEMIRATLLGKNGVQNLDDEAHIHRKSLFMSFITAENILQLRSIMLEWFEIYSSKWTTKDQVVLYEEFQEILTRTVCSWVGIKLPEEDVKKRTTELTAMFDAAARGPAHLKSRVARKKSELWIENIVRDVRRGKYPADPSSPLFAVSHFEDLDGKRLSPKVAAVEILNILRPTVAVSLYFVFCLHALHLHPESKERLRSQEPGYLDNFVQEVRRFYPFFPSLVARVREDFMWGLYRFNKGTRVMLDIYGINHDPREWERPHEFRPDRFKSLGISAFNFVPQGVGDHDMDHRCPGELITIELMRATVNFFVNDIDFLVPKQDLRVDMSRLPAMPKSRMIINHVRRTDLSNEIYA